jgi:hypothetical protein
MNTWLYKHALSSSRTKCDLLSLSIYFRSTARLVKLTWAKVHSFGNDMICQMPYYFETVMQFYVSRKYISFEVAIISFLTSYGRHIGRACGEVFFTTLYGAKVENL